MTTNGYEDCQKVRCREVRNDLTGRRRYLVRTRDPDTLQPHDDAVWTDYDDDERYGDYTVAGASGAAADLRGYEPGLWQREGSSGLTAVPLADQIGTMRQMAIGSGTKRRQVYTAFGEAVHAWEFVPGLPATATRYQYAGDWGYETGLLAVQPEQELAPPSAGWQHVGERFYDPALGRFLQRDPIGITGDINVHEYADSTPSTAVDVYGLDRWYVDTGVTGHHYVIVQNALGLFNNAPFLRVDFFNVKDTGWFFDMGNIQITPYRDKPSGQRFVSDPDEDAAMICKARQDEKQPPGYNILLYNCKSYARYIVTYGMDPGRRWKYGWRYN